MILKNNYYCFIAGLPEVFLDDRKLALSVNGFRELAREALKKEDVKLMELFFLPADNKQVLRLLSKMAPDTNLETVYPLQRLEDEITEPTHSLPVYLNRFIADFKREHLKYDVSPENVLSWMYYDHLMKSGSKFVRNYAEFVMNVKNLETALTCRKYGKEVAPEIIGEEGDFSDGEHEPCRAGERTGFTSLGLHRRGRGLRVFLHGESFEFHA